MARLRERRMREVVGAIARHRAAHGYAPSVGEVMAASGFASTSHAAHWLRACGEAGLIVRAPRIARSITLTAAGRALAAEPGEQEAPPSRDGLAKERVQRARPALRRSAFTKRM